MTASNLCEIAISKLINNVNDPFFGETLEGREFYLTPAGLKKGERDDIFRISPNGEMTIE